MQRLHKVPPVHLALLALTVAGGLWAAAPAGAQQDPGEAAFKRTCAGCHRDAQRLRGRATALKDPARREELDRFLAHHHTTDPSERAAIVAWLASVRG